MTLLLEVLTVLQIVKLSKAMDTVWQILILKKLNKWGKGTCPVIELSFPELIKA